jgi:mannitol/fructose-specific phosphotransferase system IIA component (Ntr-type)
MRLTEILSESTIKVPLEGSSKEDLVGALVELLYPELEPAARAPILDSILERERLMSTGIGSGIALPHGNAPPGVSLVVALGIPATPVDFDAVDGEPVELVFLILCNQEKVTFKMKALARISRLLHREEFRRDLAGSSSPAEAMRVITEEEARHRI